MVHRERHKVKIINLRGFSYRDRTVYRALAIPDGVNALGRRKKICIQVLSHAHTKADTHTVREQFFLTRVSDPLLIPSAHSVKPT